MPLTPNKATHLKWCIYWFAVWLEKQHGVLCLNWLLCHINVLCAFLLTYVKHKLRSVNYTNIWLRHQTSDLTTDALVDPKLSNSWNILWEFIFWQRWAVFLPVFLHPLDPLCDNSTQGAVQMQGVQFVSRSLDWCSNNYHWWDSCILYIHE